MLNKRQYLPLIAIITLINTTTLLPMEGDPDRYKIVYVDTTTDCSPLDLEYEEWTPDTHEHLLKATSIKQTLKNCWLGLFCLLCRSLKKE